jgi:hypothetical protein
VATVVIASATTTSKPTATPGPFCLGLGLVDLQGASAEISSVQRQNGFIGLVGAGHFYKGEAARTTGFTVGHHAYLFDRAVGLEKGAQFGFRGAVGQVSNVEVLHCISSLCIISANVRDGLDRTASGSRGGNGLSRRALERATVTERTAEIRWQASRMPQRLGLAELASGCCT